MTTTTASSFHDLETGLDSVWADWSEHPDHFAPFKCFTAHSRGVYARFFEGSSDHVGLSAHDVADIEVETDDQGRIVTIWLTQRSGRRVNIDLFWAEG